MRRNNRKNPILTVLLVVLCLGLIAGLAFGKYAGEWNHLFGLIISPVQQVETDTSLRRYFRSNELLPASEGAAYTVNGTNTWFSVANALDSSTVSEDTVKYSLTWYISTDGSTWTEHKREGGTFSANTYDVKRYTVEPVTVSGTTYNMVKVCGKTSSFKQEDIEAVYTFTYSDYVADVSYADGVITVDIDTNDMAGEYIFTWAAGIAPDNSDPTGIFANAVQGAGVLTATLGRDTGYTFYFFVTDAALLSQLNADPAEVTTYVAVNK